MIDLLQNILEFFLLVTLIHISKEKWQIQKTFDHIFPSSPSINKTLLIHQSSQNFNTVHPPPFKFFEYILKL